MAEQVKEESTASHGQWNLDAGLQHVINGRYATDPVLRDIQVQIDRAVAEASMYGIGSMMTTLRHLLAKPGR